MEEEQMRLSDLTPAGLARLKQIRFDMIIEKREGPEEWDGWRLQAGPEGCEVTTLGGFDVLLPVPQKHHAAIALVSAPAVSSDGRTLTLFLADRSYGHDDESYSQHAGTCTLLVTRPQASRQ
jgi:hypothetical protein